MYKWLTLSTRSLNQHNRDKDQMMMAGINSKEPAGLEDWNGAISGALDKLFLQWVAGEVQHYHCPPTLASLAQHSPQRKKPTKVLRLFSQDHFFALSNEVYPITVIFPGHRSWSELSTGAHTTMGGSRPVTGGQLWLSWSPWPALPAHTNVFVEWTQSFSLMHTFPYCLLHDIVIKIG